jgi:SAM-dependent methyltransferase
MANKPTLVDFNTSKDNYQEAIEKSIGFMGQRHDFYTQVKADVLLRLADTNPSAQTVQLLDIGCGHGLIHPYLEKRFAITGTDVAGEVLELAKRANPGVNYQQYSGTKLPFVDASFDMTLAICVMHHVPPAAWHNFLAEMRRVLRPSGMAVIIEHNPWNPMTRYVVTHNELDEGVTMLSGPRSRRLLACAGFARVSDDYILFTPFALKPFRRLDRLLKWCPLGAQYIAVGYADGSGS